MSAKDSKSSTKSPANSSPSQRPGVPSSRSTIALEPTFASPSTGSTTSSTVLQPVSAVSTSAAIDAGAISPQLVQQIVSSQRSRVQIGSSTISLEPTFSSLSTGSTTSSTVLETVSVASTPATPDAGTISPQLLDQIASLQRPRVQTRSSAIFLEPTIASPSTGSTSSTVLETVSVASTSAAPDAGTISPQLLNQIASLQRPRVQTRSSAIFLEPTIASPSTSSTSSTVLETVSVASTSAAPDAGTISPQLLKQIVSLQRPRVQTRSSTISLEPTIASPSTGSTSSTVLETVSVASTSTPLDASTISPQLLKQIVSLQRPRVQTRSSTISLEPTVASPSTGSTSSTVLETVSVASTSTPLDASTISPQLLKQIVSLQRPRVQTRSSTISLEPTIASPSTGLTSSTVLETVGVASALAASDAGTISPQLLEQIVSAVTLNCIAYFIVFPE
ncbi:Hypothetical predicted protein [Paramuricea clavata]|uniref:Uncharacterized protein n=1 Tax=Paramuricea clavata TaxID=317549 RepID=A0A6S7HFG7_PARCT|nr:Hypothetical predicted protein [Paramuricea clavata]